MSEEKEQYIVSARKYRPLKFDEVVGQEHITTTLKNAIKTQHLAHAYLFCGPRGVGKTTCARILARTINCENPTEDMEACGECSTCQAFQTNSALNIFELDAASNNSAEDIRRLIEQVRYSPQHGKYKIYIIDEVHMLSAHAFNAFLKTLEEPPSYAIFILATTEKHKILPTILSRCQIFDFKRIRPKEVVAHLKEIVEKEKYTAEDAALHIIAQKSEGCMRDALSIMDRLAGFSNGHLSFQEVIEHLNILDATSYFKLSELLWGKDLGGTFIFLDELLQKGFEGDQIINGFAEHFRNLLLTKDLRMARLLDIPDAFRKQYFNHSQLISDSYILSALSILNDAEINYKMALNKRLHLELCLIRLTYLSDLTLPSSMVKETEAEVKKKLIEPTLIIPQSNTEELTETKIQTQTPDLSEKKVPQSVETPINQTAVEQPPVLQNNITENKVSGSETQSESQKKSTPPPLKGVPTLKKENNILNELYKKVEEEEKPKGVQLTQEMTEELFQQFKEQSRDGNITFSEQMALMKIILEKEDEIVLFCCSEINEAYGKTAASQFRTFVRKKTGLNTLRVKTVLDLEYKPEVPVEKIKTKQDILDEMMEKNPALRQLKNDLNLSIDY